MRSVELSSHYLIYDGDLPAEDALLLEAARSATSLAYAPYSRFHVGAAARMASSGVIVKGANQENASFPAGICAERSLLSVAAALYPGEAISALAISYVPAAAVPITPCGICRQSIAEFQARTGGRIRLILGGASGPVWVFEDAGALLPLTFTF
jgi:cytidine deaminase